ncbi:UNVERIFIED_CONTAM: hypothetical protein GTU68_066842 [Idotea baltica]|nr:hypothetical protein [Idotea baltica]
MADFKFTLDKIIKLEGGRELLNPTVSFSTYGKLNNSKTNVVWVCHALTGNSHVFQWWEGLFGFGKVFNERDHFIICANVLGSHYGTTGPLSTNPETGKKYYHDFPLITVRDMVKLHIELADHIGIEDISVLIGGSMGGHQALEWSIMQEDRIKQLVVVAGSARISPWASAFSASQRMAIEMDPTWKNESDDAGIEGMKIARSIALLSYRSPRIYAETQAEIDNDQIHAERANSYQIHQGEKLANRFNAFSYWYLSKAMDTHNIGRYRSGVKTALQKIKASVLVISIEDDLLYPKEVQFNLVKHLKKVYYKIIPSKYGHDGFLIEADTLNKTLGEFLLVVRDLCVRA